MKKVFFRKNLEYDPTFKGKFSRYEGFLKISVKDFDPEILPGQKLLGRKKTNSFCSTALRSRQSVVNGTELNILDEIRFNLGNLLTRDEYGAGGSNLVRERFLLFFEKDLLDESRINVQDRLNKLLRFIEDLPNGKYLFVSHSFVMKIFETYLKEPGLFEKPEKLRGYLNPQNKTYNFGEGFEYEC